MRSLPTPSRNLEYFKKGLERRWKDREDGEYRREPINVHTPHQYPSPIRQSKARQEFAIHNLKRQTSQAMDNQQSQAFRPKTDYTTDNPKSHTSQADEQSSAGGSGGIGDKLSSVASGSTESSGDSQSYLEKGK